MLVAKVGCKILPITDSSYFFEKKTLGPLLK